MSLLLPVKGHILFKSGNKYNLKSSDRAAAGLWVLKGLVLLAAIEVLLYALTQMRTEAWSACGLLRLTMEPRTTDLKLKVRTITLMGF